MEIVTLKLWVAISFFVGGKEMRHIGEKMILLLCIAVFGIAAVKLIDIGKEYYDGQKEYKELKAYIKEVPVCQPEKMKGDEGTVEMYSFWKDAEKSGMEKGKQQGKLGLILLQLKKILGKLTPELEIKLEKSSEESLDTIGIHILEIHNEEDVLKWL